MGWLLPILQFLPSLPAIIDAIKHALDNRPTEALSEADLVVHEKAKSFVDVCHGAMCTK